MTAEPYFDDLTNEQWECLRGAWAKGLNYAVRVVESPRERLEILAQSGTDVLARVGARLLVLKDGESLGVEVTALARQLLVARNGASLLERIALRLVSGEGEEALRLLRAGLSGRGDENDA